MLFEVAVVGDAHPELEVITQLTTSAFAKAALVYVALFVPTLPPLSFHWYAGVVPPFVGVAVKVTLVPAQIVLPGFAAILTAGTTDPVTTIVTVFEVAVAAEVHVAFEVITQLTVLPLAKAAFV